MTNVIFGEANFTVGVNKEANPNGKSISPRQEMIFPIASQLYTFPHHSF